MTSVMQLILPPAARQAVRMKGRTLKIYQQPLMFQTDWDASQIPIEDADKIKPPTIEAARHLIKRMKEECEKRQKKLQQAEQKAERVRQQAREKLNQYRSTHVSLPRFNLQVSATKQAMAEKAAVAKRVARSIRYKLEAEELAERIQQKRLAERATLSDMIKEMNRTIDSQVKQLDMHQHFIDKCMANAEKFARSKDGSQGMGGTPMPTVKCHMCPVDEPPKPIFHFQIRVPSIASKQMAKHWCVNPVCHACRKKKLQAADQKRKEIMKAASKWLASGSKKDLDPDWREKMPSEAELKEIGELSASMSDKVDQDLAEHADRLED